MAITHLRITDDIKIDKTVDTDAVYYVFNPPMGKDDLHERKVEAYKKLDAKQHAKLRHMLKLANMGMKTRLFDRLEEMKDAYLIFNIVRMRGRDLVRFCEEFSFVPLFDIGPEQIRRFASTHGVSHHEKKLMKSIADDISKPRDRCLMLVPLAVYMDMMEKSFLNNPGG